MRAGQGPSVLRPLVIALHWTTLVLIVAWLAGGLPGWGLACHALIWGTSTAIWGLRGGPSPALKSPWREAVVYGQIALLLLYLIGAGLARFDSPLARPVLIATLAGAGLHAALNLWRAGVLGDGAFRRMLPKILH